MKTAAVSHSYLPLRSALTGLGLALLASACSPVADPVPVPVDNGAAGSAGSGGGSGSSGSGGSDTGTCFEGEFSCDEKGALWKCGSNRRFEPVSTCAPGMCNAKAGHCQGPSPKEPPDGPLMCDMGRANCDDDEANGCEVELATNPKHCGACGNDCDAGQCKGGICQPWTVRGGLNQPRALKFDDAGNFYLVDQCTDLVKGTPSSVTVTRSKLAVANFQCIDRFTLPDTKGRVVYTTAGPAGFTAFKGMLRAFILPHTDIQLLKYNELLWSETFHDGILGLAGGNGGYFVAFKTSANDHGVAFFDVSGWQSATGVQLAGQPEMLISNNAGIWALVGGSQGYLQSLAAGGTLSAPIPVANAKTFAPAGMLGLIVATTEGELVRVETSPPKTTSFNKPAITQEIDQIASRGDGVVSLRGGKLYHLNAKAEETALLGDGVTSFALTDSHYYYLTGDALMAGLLPKEKN